VTAPPPGWGQWNRTSWRRGLAAYALGTLLGAAAAAGIWYALGTPVHLPRWLLGLLMILLALVTARLLPLRLPSSPWRVPRSWGVLGHVAYSAVFGAALGTGLATALPSAGLFAMIGWSLTTPGWAMVWPVFLAFGLARALPTLLIAARAARRGIDPETALDQAMTATTFLRPAECLLLAALAVALLTG
jgi:hypothetical protein